VPGPPGPTAVSANAGNAAILGTDSLIFVPSPINYSTAEQWTGLYWVDGKKIYQKTINTGALPNATITSTAHGIVNISFMTHLSVVATDGNYLFQVPYIDPNNLAYCVGAYCNHTYIYLNAGYNRSDYTISYATMQYTCTDR
jgi:hypothetical protein